MECIARELALSACSVRQQRKALTFADPDLPSSRESTSWRRLLCLLDIHIDVRVEELKEDVQFRWTIEVETMSQR